jgi:tRNA(fMet)-specific endonuclease VapC
MNYLLDTNVVSEFRKPQPNAALLAWLAQVNPATTYLSVITIGELQKGIAKLTDETRRRTLQVWLEEDLLVRFAAQMVALDTGVLLVWGRLLAQLEKSGRTMPVMDSLIAATALHGNFVLVTRNVADFAATGVQVLNPWR